VMLQDWSICNVQKMSSEMCSVMWRLNIPLDLNNELMAGCVALTAEVAFELGDGSKAHHGFQVSR
jgi:hypothetical protein